MSAVITFDRQLRSGTQRFTSRNANSRPSPPRYASQIHNRARDSMRAALASGPRSNASNPASTASRRAMSLADASSEQANIAAAPSGYTGSAMLFAPVMLKHFATLAPEHFLAMTSDPEIPGGGLVQSITIFPARSSAGSELSTADQGSATTTTSPNAAASTSVPARAPLWQAPSVFLISSA